MVFGEMREILFWNDMEKLLREEKRLMDKYRPDVEPENRQLYSQEVDRFVLKEIFTKAAFFQRIMEYEQNGKPQWAAGRNPCCDDLSILQLKKAYKNRSRGAERAEMTKQGAAVWAGYIDDYVKNVTAGGPNEILELTIGAGFGTAAVVEKMTDDDFYVGVDIDFKCVNNAEGILRHYKKNGLAIATSLWNLPFDDNSFSVICSHLGIDECREIPQILSEAVRVLTDEGRIVLTCSDTGLKRTASYFSLYGINSEEAVACLRRVRHYADREQVDEIMESRGMKRTDFYQHDGQYVVVYQKDSCPVSIR